MVDVKFAVHCHFALGFSHPLADFFGDVIQETAELLEDGVVEPHNIDPLGVVTLSDLFHIGQPYIAVVAVCVLLTNLVTQKRSQFL